MPTGPVDKQSCSLTFNSHGRGVPAYTPQSNAHGPYAPGVLHHSSDTAAFDLARYLPRSQLVSSGLIRFDDKPENYSIYPGNCHLLTPLRT